MSAVVFDRPVVEAKMIGSTISTAHEKRGGSEWQEANAGGCFCDVVCVRDEREGAAKTRFVAFFLKPKFAACRPAASFLGVSSGDQARWLYLPNVRGDLVYLEDRGGQTQNPDTADVGGAACVCIPPGATHLRISRSAAPLGATTAGNLVFAQRRSPRFYPFAE